MKDAANPWLVEEMQDAYPGCQTCDAADRVLKIRRSADVAWLRRVLAWGDNQVAVRRAAERRLRVLSRERRGA